MNSITRKKLRILMLAPQFRPLVGGYERAAERLSGVLVKMGVDVTVITEQRNSTWPTYEIANGVTIRRLPCIYRRHLHTVSSVLTFFWFLIIYGWRYDIWHIHQYGVHSTLSLILGKIFHRPVVLKLTNTAGQGLKSTLENGFYAKILANIHKSVSGIVALSKETATEAIEFGIPIKRIHLIGNGVDTETFKPRNEFDRSVLKAKLGLGTKKIILFVGRLAEAKNVNGLLNAWSLTDNGIRKDWQLVLVGDGPLRQEMEDLSQQYMISESVSFVGQQNNIDEWLGASEIYISTSWHEGLSNSLLEAMATGMPVIATCVSGVSELVDSNKAGISVRIGDMIAISNAIKIMANDISFRDRCGKAGRLAIESNYSLIKIGERTHEMYQSLTKF